MKCQLLSRVEERGEVEREKWRKELAEEKDICVSKDTNVRVTVLQTQETAYYRGQSK